MGRAPVRVFYSYSHDDRRMLERLRTHLSMLRRQELITEWCDRDIEAGAEWREEIGRELQAADVILLLVSPDFVASDFCYEHEMMSAMERAERGEVTVIGVMLRPVDGWERTPFAKFQLVPSNARPITTWSNVDKAYAEVASSIRKMLEARLRSNTVSGLPNRGDIPRATDVSVRPDAAARARQIATALGEMDRDGFITVSGEGDGGYFIQCYREGSREGKAKGFHCVGADDDQLGAARTARLAELGWNPPETNKADGGVFWWCVREDLMDAAALIARTLNEVYGVPLDVPFQLEISKF